MVVSCGLTLTIHAVYAGLRVGILLLLVTSALPF